jgi:hypothetical protein
VFDDLAAYYHENVVAAFIAYCETSKDGVAGRSRDLREAVIAATALFHLREHLPKAGAPSRAEVERRCPDYALLGDVVNAAKHKSISQNTPHGAPLVSNAEKLMETVLVIEYEDAEGVYRCTQKSVVAKLTDGSKRDLLEVLTNVINFWEAHLHTLGVLSSPRVFVFEPQIRHRTRAECEQMRLDFELVQGHRFRQSMQFLRFDASTGQAHPIDLSGAELKFRIFKPRFDFAVSLKHEATGKEYSKAVVLSDEENGALADMGSDEERQAFAATLPSARAALRDLAAEAGLIDTNIESQDRQSAK